MRPVGTALFSEDLWSTLELSESQFDAQVTRLESEVIGLRRHLHAHPEPSGEERETSQFIARHLSQAGLEPRLCKNGIGVVADQTIGEPSAECPLIAIRGDIDALRMPDDKQVEYRSRHPDLNHACGHDGHMAILLGAALSAARMNGADADDHAKGLRLRYVFQPAEETSEGAAWMVDQGALEGVDAILGLHVDPEKEVGTVGIRYGVLTAYCDDVEIEILGRGGHAARPHHTIDPIATAAHLLNSLYGFLPRSVDSRNPSVLTIGRIRGGGSPNVISERVELGGTLRTTDTTTRETLMQRVRSICSGIEHNSGATINVRFTKPLPAVNNHPRIAAALEAASRRVLGPENVGLIDRPSMGGEDFAVYLDHVPGALLRLGCGKPGVTSPFLHSPIFDIDERALGLGTRILMRAAWLLALESPASD